MEQIENKMVVDWAWDEVEYGVPNKRRLKRLMQDYEDEERGEREYESL